MSVAIFSIHFEHFYETANILAVIQNTYIERIIRKHHYTLKIQKPGKYGILCNNC